MKIDLQNLLSRAEIIFKTDIRYILKGSIWLSTGQVISVIAALLVTLAAANLLPPTVYGMYKYALAVGGIIAAFSLTGMGTAVTQAVARGYEGSLQNGVRVSLYWGLGMTVIAWAMGLYYYSNHNNSLALLLFVVGLFQPLLNSLNLYSPYLIGKKAFKQSTGYHLLRSSVTTLSLLVSLWFTTNPVLILLAYFSSHTIAAIIIYVRIVKTSNLNSKIDKETIPYCKHLSLMNVLKIVAEQIDKVLVFQFVGAAELAIYALAIAVPEQIKAIFKSLANLALPKFAEHKSLDSMRVGITEKTIRLGIILLLVIFLYIPAAPYLYDLVFPQYATAVPLSQLFSLSLLSAIGILPFSALQAQMKHALLYKINIIGSIFQILFISFGAFFYGILGVVLARVATRYMYIAIAYYFLYTQKTIRD